jgi:hypothetical protein
MFLTIYLILHFGGLIGLCIWDPHNLGGRRP